jgi:glycosyltransferase involved in cell wall biosynthesis
MSPTFSLVYPTRHRPEFIRQALRILEMQRQGSFEVVVCDNLIDPALTCEEICRGSTLPNLTYVRPPQPLGMVENWNHALQFATGDYVCYLTDKMFVLPDALEHIERAVDAAGGPDSVCWPTDVYNPASFADYFGGGRYWSVASDVRSGLYQRYAPSEELDRRGRAEVSRGEQSASQYARGKIVFGAYRRDLVQRIVERSGALFHNISPDYTSMLLGLTEAKDAIELAVSCVVSINTDISNGVLADASDAAALGFLRSLDGGAEGVLPNLLVPGLYASSNNLVAHDFLAMKRSFDLSFEFSMVNWLVYCSEDIYRLGRNWSDPKVEAEQKGMLQAFLQTLEPAVVAAIDARINARAASKRAQRSLYGLLRDTWQRLTPSRSPSMQAAIESSVAYRTWADAPVS